MTHPSDPMSPVAAVQVKLQELMDSLPPDQAEVLESFVLRPARALDATAAQKNWQRNDERSIIIVGGRSARWFNVGLDDYLVELNPQPLPPDPPPDVTPGG